MFKQKYLKYKKKYLELQLKLKLQLGGDKALINNINGINLFVPDSDMEQHLNPIYGLYMCSCGYITNNYFLKDSDFISTEESILIRNISQFIPGEEIKPINFFRNNIKPIDFGRYIAFKYIYKYNKDLFQFIENETYIADILKKFKSFNFLFMIRKKGKKYYYDDIIYFHILLYVFWWSANNDSGIEQYYNGINEVFNFVNDTFKLQEKYVINQNSLAINNNFFSFEKKIFEITKEDFKIYSMGNTKNFCNRVSEQTYSDCGEVTARNLINLLCVNKNNFDIEYLNYFGAIPELIKYYQVFNNFEIQSNTTPVSIIYNDEDVNNLNARDAWSKLIIFYANNNIRFSENCNSSNKKFNVDGGSSINPNIPNFLQLIRNLLPGIRDWNNLMNDRITSITENETESGYDIEIIHRDYDGTFIIHCNIEHYSMEFIKLKKINYTYNDNNDNPNAQKKNEMIKILLNELPITIDNYLWFNIDSELIVEMLNNSKLFKNNIELYKKLIELSLTDKYNSDVRGRINITVENTEIFNILEKYNAYYKINEFNYKCKNFNFVPILRLTHLNSTIIDSELLKSIDLSPLSNLESIGNDFMNNCENLKSIDLSPLSNIKSIGNNFMMNCNSLENIDLSPLSNLESIGNDFMNNCENLKSIDLSPLSNVKSIGNNFMTSCRRLENIDLSPLSNIKSIGDEFINMCDNLTNINFVGLSNIESIGYRFMNYCNSLVNIDLSSLINIKSIGDYFMLNCTNLQSINLSGLLNLQSIGNNFLNYCTRLVNIDLSPLSNLKSIGYAFLNNCKNLQSIDLSGLSNLESIGDIFISSCKNLKDIDLSALINLKSIGNDFMSRCVNLISIDLSGLSNLESIGDNFMSRCENLKDIKLSSNLKSIGDNFMDNCISLQIIDLSGLINLQSIGPNILNFSNNVTIICTENQEEMIRNIYKGNIEIVN